MVYSQGIHPQLKSPSHGFGAGVPPPPPPPPPKVRVGYVTCFFLTTISNICPKSNCAKSLTCVLNTFVVIPGAYATTAISIGSCLAILSGSILLWSVLSLP